MSMAVFSCATTSSPALFVYRYRYGTSAVLYSYERSKCARTRTCYVLVDLFMEEQFDGLRRHDVIALIIAQVDVRYTVHETRTYHTGIILADCLYIPVPGTVRMQQYVPGTWYSTCTGTGVV